MQVVFATKYIKHHPWIWAEMLLFSADESRTLQTPAEHNIILQLE